MRLYFLIFFFSFFWANAQFHPPAGYPGTSAIHKDSATWLNWANACQIFRGYQDISSPALGFATVGDSTSVCGMAGSNGVASLGDGGYAIVQFPNPILNGEGYDFAVFENSFSDDYLELAFVEVSSDGINYFRFPSVSNTQDSLQVGTFGLLDASRINNFAGKYRMNYGTPFDLQEVSGMNGLDVNHVTHIKIIDVVGSLSDSLASFDSQGKKINDPWPTPFASSGFDLDAVGVLHQQDETGIDLIKFHSLFSTFQTQSGFVVFFQSGNLLPSSISLLNLSGDNLISYKILTEEKLRQEINLPVTGLPNGIYLVQVVFENGYRANQRVLFLDGHN